MWSDPHSSLTVVECLSVKTLTLRMKPLRVGKSIRRVYKALHQDPPTEHTKGSSRRHRGPQEGPKSRVGEKTTTSWGITVTQTVSGVSPCSSGWSPRVKGR